jgi:hypothetical protein
VRINRALQDLEVGRVAQAKQERTGPGPWRAHRGRRGRRVPALVSRAAPLSPATKPARGGPAHLSGVGGCNNNN